MVFGPWWPNLCNGQLSIPCRSVITYPREEQDREVKLTMALGGPAAVEVSIARRYGKDGTYPARSKTGGELDPLQVPEVQHGRCLKTRPEENTHQPSGLDHHEVDVEGKRQLESRPERHPELDDDRPVLFSNASFMFLSMKMIGS